MTCVIIPTIIGGVVAYLCAFTVDVILALVDLLHFNAHRINSALCQFSHASSLNKTTRCTSEIKHMS